MVSKCLRRPRMGAKGSGDDSGVFSHTPAMMPFTSRLRDFNSDDQIARAEAINWMAQNPDPLTRPYLGEILRGPDRRDARDTIFLLMRGGVASLPVLLDGFEAQLPDVRSMCISSVSSLLRDEGDIVANLPLLVPQLLLALSDPHAPVQEEARRLLIRLAGVSPDAVLANIDPLDPQAQVAISLVQESINAVKISA